MNYLYSVQYKAIRYIFQRYPNKDLETFKLCPQEYRHQIFDLLDKKDLEAFKQIPENYRHEAFKYLDWNFANWESIIA